MRGRMVIGLAAVSALVAGCSSGSGSGKLDEAEATRIADAMIKTWESGDSTRIKALYADTVVGYDAGVAEMAADRAAWDKLQDAYAAAKFDKIDVTKRRIQVLDSDTFVVTHEGTDARSSSPDDVIPFRCTDVFEKSADDRWLVVNEHCSMPPKPTFEAPSGA